MSGVWGGAGQSCDGGLRRAADGDLSDSDRQICLYLETEALAETSHHLVHRGVDDEGGLLVPLRLLQIHDNEVAAVFVDEKGPLVGGFDLEGGAEDEVEVGDAGLSHRRFHRLLWQLVLPVQNAISHPPSAPNFLWCRAFEAGWLLAHGWHGLRQDFLPSASLAVLEEHVAVKLGQSIAGKSGAHVQTVHVLTDEKL